MGYIKPGIPEQLVLKLLDGRRIPNFVETGTNEGRTAFWAARHFERVLTIEIEPALSRATAALPGCPQNIEFLIGDSAQLLPGLVERLAEPAVFWLDGHYSGPGTGGIEAECPVMEELAAIAKAKEPIIMIDDLRLFLGAYPNTHKPEHWPSLDDIWRFLVARIPENFNTIADDVIISVPHSLKPILDRDWAEHFSERYPAAQPPPTLPQRALRKLSGLWSG